MESFDTDVVVVGAGVVGLAVARALALAGREVLILEKNPVMGEETSARNSEVIHAGIYYPPGTLKARHCRRGRDLLHRYCEARGVGHRRCGKLIVASDTDEAARLPQIAAHAQGNGVTDLRLIGAAELQALEPALRASAALFSPSTGIVDSHALMLALLGEAEAHGAQLVTRSPVSGGQLCGDGSAELAVGGDEPMLLRCRSLVNCAGLWAPALSARIDGLPPPPGLALVKGNYFALSRPAPFSRLIYPVPRDGGLGVHFTLDLAGRGKFGPDTEWLDDTDPARIDYTVNPERRAGFAEAIARYWPAIEARDLSPDYAGLRPKIAGAAYGDFVMLGPGQLAGPHALLYGIESPGLTSALSIAEEVADWLAEG
ncbi:MULTISPECIES: NAD(P)/FAD-dependent oxidoreductase [Marinovum]|uniref:NAD(P)/FAD-dependent oxidoreductase n=1 Tax=Marinovum TaxID=367771 RepID=UPI00237A4A0B|nr:NAD(P)/FAD-dependent oxidoreductase [Marinovum sp. PR37]MDD9744011.1 NAD(P)/FAD-dependent oxidoreductase [Marinovum sp. PR37]